MNSKVFVTEEELIVERTPQDLIDWVEKKIQKIIQQEGGKEALRMREGLCKDFIEEVYPLRILTGFQFNDRNDVKLRPVIGNQNYDVLITDYAFSPPRTSKLEITQAHEGENQFLRRLMLQQQGWSPLTGSIKKTGTKNTGIKVEGEIVARDVQDSLNNQIKLINQALHRKLQKDYESNTSLLIMFEDTIAYRVADAKEVLQSFIQDEWTRITKFSTLYLAGWSQHIFLKYPLDSEKAS